MKKVLNFLLTCDSLWGKPSQAVATLIPARPHESRGLKPPSPNDGSVTQRGLMSNGI